MNTDEVLKQMDKVAISMHCWQADDVTGFENPDGQLSVGIQATGNYPARHSPSSRHGRTMKR